jgi:DNA-binding transcriptional regulator YiaG
MMNKKQLVEKASMLNPPFSKEDLLLIRKSFSMSRKDFARHMLKIPYSTLEKWEMGVVENMPAVAHTAYSMILHMRQREYFPCILDWSKPY